MFARLRHCKGFSLFTQILHHVLKHLGAVFCYRTVSHVHGGIIQRAGQTADVVLMGVGRNHVVQVVRPMALQVGIYQIRILSVAAVNEHVMAVADHQSGVRLAYVNKVDLKAASFRGRSRSARSGKLIAAGKRAQQQDSEQCAC